MWRYVTSVPHHLAPFFIQFLHSAKNWRQGMTLDLMSFFFHFHFDWAVGFWNHTLMQWCCPSETLCNHLAHPQCPLQIWSPLENCPVWVRTTGRGKEGILVHSFSSASLCLKCCTVELWQEWGLICTLQMHVYLMFSWSTYEPHPQWKFSNTALQTLTCYMYQGLPFFRGHIFSAFWSL